MCLAQVIQKMNGYINFDTEVQQIPWRIANYIKYYFPPGYLKNLHQVSLKDVNNIYLNTTVADTQAYLWNYHTCPFDSLLYYTGEPYSEDLSHGALDINFMMNEYLYGFVFDENDMKKLSNTLVFLSYSKDIIYGAENYRSYKYLNQTNNILDYYTHGSNWLPLVSFNPKIYEIAYNVSANTFFYISQLAYYENQWEPWMINVPDTVTIINNRVNYSVRLNNIRILGDANIVLDGDTIGNLTRSDISYNDTIDIDIYGVTEGDKVLRIQIFDTIGGFTRIGPYKEYTINYKNINNNYNDKINNDSIVILKNIEINYLSHPALYVFKEDNHTNINCYIPESSHMLLRIYDVTGKIIKYIQKNCKFKGVYSYNLNNLPAGTYFAQLKTNIGEYTKKFIILE